MPRRTLRGKIKLGGANLPAGPDGWIGPDVSPSVGPVLARWTYAPEEWEAYTHDRYRYHPAASWLVGVLLAALAFWFGVKNVSLPVLVLLVGATLAAGVIGTALSLTRTRRHNLALARPTVVVGVNGVLAPGQPRVEGDEHTRVTAVRYLAYQEHPELEIAFTYPGQGGEKVHTTKVLIPRGHEVEAVELVDRFAEGRWYHDTTPVDGP